MVPVPLYQPRASLFAVLLQQRSVQRQPWIPHPMDMNRRQAQKNIILLLSPPAAAKVLPPLLVVQQFRKASAGSNLRRIGQKRVRGAPPQSSS